MTMSPEVVICGAGAAGLTLAIELARRGVAFRLLEQRDQPFPGSRGKGIQPRSQEMFEDMGLIHRLFAAGGLYPVFRTHRADGSWVDTVVVEGGPATPAEPYRSPLMVPQFLTEAVLRARLSELGHQVEFGHALLDVAQDAEGVAVRVATPAGEQTIATRYLIGADGGRSAVRRTLDIGFPGQTLGARAVVADIVLHGLPREAWHSFHEDDTARRISLCPLMGTALFQLQAPVPPDDEVDLSVAGLAAMLRARTGREDLVIERVCWASVYQMNARLADRYRAGRVFLVGDAAHIHPPTGGQGLNTSAQDAYNLGWKLAAVLRGAPAALLDTYEEERRPIAAAMLGLSTRLLDRARHGDQRRGREVQQLDLHYRDSSLSLQADAGERRIQPGDRAPDAPLRGAGGQPLRLFDVLRGTHWTLLGYVADRALAPACRDLHVHIIGPAAELRDAHGHFADAYAPHPGEWLLVRPDGYVAARVATPHLAALIGHFQRHAG
ncbi:2-polyprenyl-6-methoxyphenol hydroxylase-like FAD-dependent oxidoreductase [Xanthomonas sacchari]|uniref:FAD-dependent oxidoreductase n=1 Tax=Xanthomonas sacchari TaxID=56458 RepID=UPI002780EAB3|nr:FAD-dependent oxidoreductase [Xanthomonas sacchari]MDQ1091173.1 2-polyprenyl-6-methoxyphenol hydroxylase-like FAD-dependent oxidoreductase [Xanthomonas sacchari]